MLKAARTILEHGRSKEADELCMSIKEILELIPGTR
jgi:phosphoenolpyruvate phosphomutase